MDGLYRVMELRRAREVVMYSDPKNNPEIAWITFFHRRSAVVIVNDDFTRHKEAASMVQGHLLYLQNQKRRVNWGVRRRDNMRDVLHAKRKWPLKVGRQDLLFRKKWEERLRNAGMKVPGEAWTKESYV